MFRAVTVNALTSSITEIRMFRKPTLFTAILFKFIDKPTSKGQRIHDIYCFFGSNNVLEPVALDDMTYKMVWTNPNYKPKSTDTNADFLNNHDGWKAGTVIYAYSFSTTHLG